MYIYSIMEETKQKKTDEERKEHTRQYHKEYMTPVS
jgi:hypothetical protein